MTEILKNVTIYAGDDVEINVALKQADKTTALDLTGSQVHWALADSYDPTTPLLTKSSANAAEIVIDNAVGGLISIFLKPIDTQALGGQPYYHEIEVVGGGTTATTLTGNFTIQKTAMH